ncbi:MFS transporter [Alloscardovia criceti]|uniref:MFS transporter n=1 Tax=Alloscardovia criceti TaxID=356828 RepID=UPI001FDFC809|nr:MFS transporter [Alloscardovia criceti]
MTSDMAVRALIPLLITFILGTLCLQGFNLVFQQIGQDVGATTGQASLITAIPSIILGIVCFVYGSLGDFVSLKKLVTFGITGLVIGSVFGFVASYFFTPNLWIVIIARVLQTAGEQVAGSAFLVVATKYLKDSLKVIFFGLFTAGYQVSAAIGVFAAGFFSSIHWSFLFLIPTVTLLLLPILLANLPNATGNGEKVDALGFIIFGLAAAFLAIFFSYNAWWMMIVAIALFALFAVYIHKAEHPFVTPEFFRNTRWLIATGYVLLLFFPNYFFSPMFNYVATGVYGMTTSTASHYIVWGFIVAAIFGTSSGWIIGKIGRHATLISAMTLMTCGFLLGAFLINMGPLAMTVAAIVFYAGAGMLYSPTVSLVLGSLPQEESGRGVGMNDLAMNTTASIGIAILGTMMVAQPEVSSSLIGASGVAGNASNLFIGAAVVVIIGFIVYLFTHKKVEE